MWLRMVSKYEKVETLPNATGKSWNEWVDVLNTGIGYKCGVQPVIEYLTTEHALKPTWAQTIACQYVLGRTQQEA